MTQREGEWWPRGRPRWGTPGRTLVEEVLLVVAVVLSLAVGVLAAVVAVLVVSVLVRSLAGPEATVGLGVQIVAWGLLVALAIALPFGLVAAVVALTEYRETRTVRRRPRRAAEPPVVGATGPADGRSGPVTSGETADGGRGDDRRGG